MKVYELQNFTDPKYECANCGTTKNVNDLVYDEYADVFICDTGDCFYEWADSNFEIVAEFYEDLNLS